MTGVAALFLFPRLFASLMARSRQAREGEPGHRGLSSPRQGPVRQALLMRRLLASRVGWAVFLVLETTAIAAAAYAIGRISTIGGIAAFWGLVTVAYLMNFRLRRRLLATTSSGRG